VLGIVVPFWDPFGDSNRQANLARVLERLRAEPGARILCVEMDCGHPSGLADIVLPAGPDSVYLWQKERLVNHGFGILARDRVDCIGYVDGDCAFVNDDWARNIVTAFDGGNNFVQGFSHVTDGTNSVPAALEAWPELGARMHGGTIFFHRELYAHIGGFYEFCIVGGGDFVLMMAITGNYEKLDWIFPAEAYQQHVKSWFERFLTIDIRPACAENAVNILEHGNPQRSHRLRHVLLQDFDPEEDILCGDTLGLTEQGRRLLPRLRAYCAHRENRADIILNPGTGMGSS